MSTHTNTHTQYTHIHTHMPYPISAAPSEANASGRVGPLRSTNPNQILIQVPRGRDLCLPLAPPRLRPGYLLERCPNGPRVKSDLKPILFFHRFPMPFWINFGSDLEVFLEPFWRQNRPKFHPRCISKPYLLQKRVFHENN